jgi:two-component sensor histidine kinase
VSGATQDSFAEEPSFRDVVDALALGVPFRMHLGPDRRTRFLRVGEGCLATLGVPAEALLADPAVLADVIVPEDHDRLLSAKFTAAAGRGPWSVELRARKPGGELRWLRLTSARRPAPDGGSLLDGLIVDITEARRLGEQLAEERLRLEQAIELTGMGVFSWDRDDPETIVWSDAQYAIYDVAPQTPMTVQAFKALIHPEDYANGQEAAASLMNAADGADVWLEHRIRRRDGEVRWVLLHQRVRRDGRGLKAVNGVTLDITDRRSAEEQRRLQMGEIAHRAKNAVTVMMAMVQQAARSSETVDELADLIISRITAMARSQELATTSGGEPVQLGALIRVVLDAFDLTRFAIHPAMEPLTLEGTAGVSLALLLHELATNAVKYGALSNASGRVALSLEAVAGGQAVLTWRESGGPPVRAPERKGFGMRLLATVMKSRGGSVTPSFAAEGFAARIVLPIG